MAMVDKSELPAADQDPLKMYGINILEALGVNSGASIEDISPWIRGGAETFVSDFFLVKDDQRSHLIAKACIKIASSETVMEWLERRKVLSENGVLFPELVAVDGATIVEEYIDYSFREAYTSAADDNVRAKLRYRYLDAFRRVVGAGFTPMSFSDVRSRGDDVVAIDVGQDIGGRTDISSCSLDVISKAESHFRSLIR